MLRQCTGLRYVSKNELNKFQLYKDNLTVVPSLIAARNVMIYVCVVSQGGGKEHDGQHAYGRVAATSSPSPFFCLQRLQRPHERLCTHHRSRHRRHFTPVLVLQTKNNIYFDHMHHIVHYLVFKDYWLIRNYNSHTTLRMQKNPATSLNYRTF